MSQRPNKSNISAQKGGLSVQELKQMTAQRMGVGPSRPQTQSIQSMNSTFPSTSSQQSLLLDPSEAQLLTQHRDSHPSIHSSYSSGISNHPLAHTTPVKLPSQHVPVSVSNSAHLNTVATPVDKGLSVQELKALTRMRLAREAGSSRGPESHSKPNSIPNSSSNDRHDDFRRPKSPPMDSVEYVPPRKSVEDYMNGILHDVSKKQLQHGTGHAPRSSSTSPTVESSSTGSDSDYVMRSYNAKNFTSSRQYPPSAQISSSYTSMTNTSDYFEIDHGASRRSRSNSMSSTEKAKHLDPFSVTKSSDYDPSLEYDRNGRERYHPDRVVHGNNSRRLEQSHHDRTNIENIAAVDRRLHEYHRHDRPLHADQEYGAQQNRPRSRHDYLPQRHHDHTDYCHDSRERDGPYNPHGKRYQSGRLEQQREVSSGGVPSEVLHAKLLNLEQQQLERELRERDLREQIQVKYRHQHEQQVREQHRREQHMWDQRRREQLLHAQQEREQHHREQQQREHQYREQQYREQQYREQQYREQQVREHQQSDQRIRDQHITENVKRELQQQQPIEHPLRGEQLEMEKEDRDKGEVQTSQDDIIHPLTLEIPDDECDSIRLPVKQEQRMTEGQPQQQLPQTSVKPPVAPLYEGSLRKMVMTKSVANNSGISVGYDQTVTPSSDNMDPSLLPSGSPFRPAVETVPDHSLVLPELQPSPPDSPRSMRHGSRRQLPVNCPAPVRMRSSSDINDLAFSVAESVLLTPTATSSVSSSQRDSMDSPRGSFSAPSITSVTNSVSNGGSGSVASGVGGSMLDGDMLMNQFSLDSNDEYTHSAVEMANNITEF